MSGTTEPTPRPLFEITRQIGTAGLLRLCGLIALYLTVLAVRAPLVVGVRLLTALAAGVDARTAAGLPAGTPNRTHEPAGAPVFRAATYAA